MAARLIPADGDVIVRRERRNGAVVYVLHAAPGPDQYVLRTRDKSVAQALTFAKRQGVRAWFKNEAGVFVLLGTSEHVKSAVDA